MLHYSCDVCKRPIDPRNDIRHVVKIEVYPAVDDSSSPECDGGMDDADHLDAVQEILERIEDEDDGPFDDAARSMRFDLCDACRQRFVRNPLGIRAGKRLDFSNN